MNKNNPFDENRKFKQSYDKTFDENALVNSASFSKKSSSFTNSNQTQNLPRVNQKTEIGSGKIEGILGTGGMARVYKVWNEKLEIYRAVKILLPNSQKELLKRFETEAKITAKLHHPNIVEIYSVGEWHELPYIEMEMVEGMTLDTIITKYGKLPPEVCCAIGIQIADALNYAHGQEFLLYGKTYKGVIHRDLKPANIMLSNNGVLKLMDFGIARPAEVGLHTMDGHIVGTLQYLSPEQLDGAAIDNRTDIYSLGTILYEILTGTKTFPQTSITNLMKMKATNKYRKFSEYDFHISPPLAKATEKCLQIKMENRYRYIKDLLKDFLKANRSLTFASPGEILQEYVKDPVKYVTDNKFRKKNTKQHIIIASSVAATICIIIAGVLLFPKKDTSSSLNQPKKTVVEQSKGTDIIKKATEPPVSKVSKSSMDNKKSEVKKPEKKVTASRPKPKKVKQTTQNPQKKVKKVTPKPQRTVSSKTIPEVKKTIEPIKTVKLTPLEKLKKKYNEEDPLTIGINSCTKGNYSDALIALTSINDKSFEKTIYYMWVLVELGNYSEARKISSDLDKKDAFADLLLGRIEAAADRNRSALMYYEEALLKPSIIKSRINIRKDALYYTALIHDKHYGNSPSAETFQHTKNAWNNLKKVYLSTPDHPRFKLANKKLASLN